MKFLKFKTIQTIKPKLTKFEMALRSDCKKYLTADYLIEDEQVKDFRIFYVDKFKLCEDLPKLIPDKFLAYCANRILSISNLANENSWIYGTDIVNGECVISIHIKNEIIDKILSTLSRLEHMPDIDKVKSCLEIEHGQELPYLSSFKIAEIRKINVSEIILPKSFASGNLNDNLILLYKEYPFPSVICSFVGGFYRLIDGFHRYQALIENNKARATIISLR